MPTQATLPFSCFSQMVSEQVHLQQPQQHDHEPQQQQQPALAQLAADAPVTGMVASATCSSNARMLAHLCSFCSALSAAGRAHSTVAAGASNHRHEQWW
jgi:hypothetical protein